MGSIVGFAFTVDGVLFINKFIGGMICVGVVLVLLHRVVTFTFGIAVPGVLWFLGQTRLNCFRLPVRDRCNGTLYA